jgi:hypothetical protein
MVKPRALQPFLIPALVALTSLIHPLPAGAQATVGFGEDFPPENGTAGFIGGAQLSNPGTGGRGGAGDGYLRIARDPFPGNLGTFNAGPNYGGNYIAAGIRYVVFWLNDVDTDEDLEIHLSVGNSTNFWQYNVGFTPPEHSWAVFAVDLADSANFTRIVGFSGNYTLALTTVDRLHWRHDKPPFTQGPDLIAGQFGLDGISLGNSTAALADLTAPGAARLILRPAFPNPTFGPARVAVELAQGAPSRVLVISPTGRLVRELYRGDLGSGAHDFSWDGRRSDGTSVSSGIYYFQIDAGGRTQSVPVTIVH